MFTNDDSSINNTESSEHGSGFPLSSLAAAMSPATTHPESLLNGSQVFPATPSLGAQESFQEGNQRYPLSPRIQPRPVPGANTALWALPRPLLTLLEPHVAPSCFLCALSLSLPWALCIAVPSAGNAVPVSFRGLRWKLTPLLSCSLSFTDLTCCYLRLPLCFYFFYGRPLGHLLLEDTFSLM